MDTLLHIRIGRELKKRIDELVEAGVFSNQAEVVREALRSLILKYDKEFLSLIKNQENKVNNENHAKNKKGNKSDERGFNKK
ncbi:MAG: ribbon-helix-helix domain-containing protein [Candidatus Woesearchaeota archaeon]